MDPNNVIFPESDAWADSMPDIRGGFAASSVRKAAGGGGPTQQSSADQDFKVFASLDLSNM